MAKDKFRYFRVEARELLDGLSKCVMEIEKGSGGKDVIARLLRFAHTLKGASRVVKLPGIAEHAHAVEDALAPYRDAGGAIPSAEIGRVMKILDEIGVKIAELDQAREAEPSVAGAVPIPTSRAAPDEVFDTVRVDINELDSLLEGLSRIGTQLSRLREHVDAVGRASLLAESISDESDRYELAAAPAGLGAVLTQGRATNELREMLRVTSRSLRAISEQAASELEQVGELSYELRLLPASSIFASLERSVFDAAQSQQKKVNFSASGGETRMDAQVLAAVRNALLHVVRNSVAHGIEPEAARFAAGKPAAGSVTLRVERRGNRVALICRDDGRGIDIDAVRRTAVQLGVITSDAAESLSLDQAVELLLRGGVTTTSNVTELSGRGVGLDVVRETVSGLKGELKVASEQGKGTTVELSVPISLSSLSALVVDAGGMTVSIPLDAVARTLRVAETEIAKSADGSSLAYNGTAIPFLPLFKALKRPAPTTTAGPRRFWTCVVIQSGGHFAALGVNRLQGTANVIVRPLPATIDADPVVAGVSLTAEGEPQLLLDPVGIMELAQRKSAPDTAKEVAKSLPVLIIDDSLTTRMLEQSILTSAGYDVETASSAEEGMEKARERRYSLFIVDVEMPGMDGFTFVERTRADPGLRDIPAVLVTSRNAPQDKLRGKQAGARAYIVKSEFDQGFLLQTIRSLIG